VHRGRKVSNPITDLNLNLNLDGVKSDTLKQVYTSMQKPSPLDIEVSNKHKLSSQTMISPNMWKRHFRYCKGQRCINWIFRFSKL
jgi:hypothetical protein